MKTTRILSLAAAVLTLAACGNEEFMENNPGNEAAKPVPMTFTAGMPQTRTQLAADNEVHWTEGDKIALWDRTAVREFTATTINGSNATFTGTATPSSTYTAFYPLIAVESMDATTITFNLPAEQTAVAGTFANQLAPSLAKATGGSTDLVFENLCALVKFTVPADMAGEGIFTLVGGNGTEALAGKYWVEYSTGNQSPVEAATRIALKGTFEAGKDYYFVVLPGTLANGFSLLYEDSTGKLYRKATGKSVTLTAGHILNLGTLASADFEKAVVKEIYAGLGSGGTATENADGTVTLSDADLTALAAMTTLDLHSAELTSLAGLGYCTGLTTLKCNNNHLTELNLSGLTKLTTLWCQMNQLTTLDVSEQTQLTELWCFKNNLNALDITQLSGLYRIYCGNQNDERELTLTLTAAQEGVWNSWSSDSDNVRVKLNVVP